jgi:hypothetical protein
MEQSTPADRGIGRGGRARLREGSHWREGFIGNHMGAASLEKGRRSSVGDEAERRRSQARDAGTLQSDREREK